MGITARDRVAAVAGPPRRFSRTIAVEMKTIGVIARMPEYFDPRASLVKATMTVSSPTNNARRGKSNQRRGAGAAVPVRAQIRSVASAMTSAATLSRLAYRADQAI
ncbi:MAG: hypothetical protein QF521_20820 [Alphaproteobacteria bacterium]|nr:hypothetical protein [Alphaproteobacteria bacterium]MDP6875975.1 hypothetical protein [Alphaproteobacteria bacterium]